MKKYSTIIIIFFLFILVSCNHESDKEFQSKTFFKMDTYITIKIPVQNKDSSYFDGAEQVIEKYDKMFDIFNEQSELSRINRTKDESIASDEVIQLLTLTRYKLYEKTNGYFSVTLEPILKFWNEPGKKYDAFPYSPEEYKEKTLITNLEVITLPLTDQKVDHKAIKLTENTSLNLGGIAKGYVVDKIYHYLSTKDKSAESFGLINAGGDVLVWGGEHKKSGCWTVGIQVPDKPQGTFDYIVKLENGAVTTSGDYERFFYVGDKKYHHIINPKSLLPSDEAHSVTVIIDNPVFIQNSPKTELLFATEADVLSTAIMCMPKEEARKFCNENNIKAIIYERDMNVFISDPLKNSKKIKLERKNNADQ